MLRGPSHIEGYRIGPAPVGDSRRSDAIFTSSRRGFVLRQPPAYSEFRDWCGASKPLAVSLSPCAHASFARGASRRGGRAAARPSSAAGVKRGDRFLARHRRASDRERTDQYV